jgi:phage shock protein A
MEEKTSAQEFRAQAYAEVSDSTMSTSQEIDKVLGQTANTDALTTIKAKRAAKTTETNSTTTNA